MECTSKSLSSINIEADSFKHTANNSHEVDKNIGYITGNLTNGSSIVNHLSTKQKLTSGKHTYTK